MQTAQTQWTILKENIQIFLHDRQAAGHSPGSIYFYRKKLELFLKFCDRNNIVKVTEITPEVLRLYLMHLAADHSPGGVHACFRALRAFLYWWEMEYEPEGWKNPIKKIRRPKQPQEILDPANIDVIQAMVNTCRNGIELDERDKAIMITLLDTGCRANELCNLNIGDIDILTGAVLIRFGKGRKSRRVFPGHTWRRVIRSYLRYRMGASEDDPLFINRHGLRLEYDGLRAIINRRAALAKILPPTLHSFRRAFAINMLRNGVDVYTLRELMGHRDVIVLQRYLKLVDDDLRIAHHNASPVDHWKM